MSAKQIGWRHPPEGFGLDLFLRESGDRFHGAPFPAPAPGFLDGRVVLGYRVRQASTEPGREASLTEFPLSSSNTHSACTLRKHSVGPSLGMREGHRTEGTFSTDISVEGTCVAKSILFKPELPTAFL